MNTPELLQYFKEASGAIDRVMEEDLAGVAEGLLPEVLRYAIFNGGKRIRPQLTVLAGQMLLPEDAPAREGLFRLAIVFEYLHAASLLHDDVIDRSEKRRGSPTANAVYGTSSVILAGDFLHARAMTLAGTVGGRECVAIVGRATEAMVEAEFLQMQAAGRVDTSEEIYFQVVSGKTGALIAAACECGAVLAGGDDQDRQAIRTYGKNIGLAFQIVDDLLDYLGDPAKTGKTIGNDLAEGKMTLPLIYACSNGSQSDKDFLAGIFSKEPQERLRLTGEATAVIESCGGFRYAREKAQTLVSEGVSGLEVFADGVQQEILKGLAGYVLSRDK
ncbi:MAG: polyprenyl synthetase family protein [Proteobacteria bacterium]|nr:polyprenyl synthetase family protein [Pseudomonadota bacterium]MBU1737263.1 polyprenyl synthetase family protein [Pseudomonadota bacterium]